MRKLLMFISVALIAVAMNSAVFACGCGGGKLKPDTKSDILTKA
jgi:hypothetical protein